MCDNVPDVSSSFQNGKWGDQSRVTSLTETPAQLCVFRLKSCTQHVECQKYAQLSQATSLFWKRTINLCQIHAFSVFSKMTMCLIVVGPSGEHLPVPMITQSSNPSRFLSEDMSLVLTNTCRAVYELFLVMILPVLMMRMRTKTCQPCESASVWTTWSHPKQSIRQQKRTENILLYPKHEPQWFPLFHLWDKPL